jgi:pumilio family protein 6
MKIEFLGSRAFRIENMSCTMSHELAEVRKKKRKPNYDLEKDVVSLWEKTRQRNIKKEDRSKLVTQILKKMEGKLPDMAVNHIMARALQASYLMC